jgi:hypothetical protein
MPDLAVTLAALVNWRQPPGGDNPFMLSCRAAPGLGAEEIGRTAPAASGFEELRVLWRTTEEAWLFEDTEYGQWGLHLMRPADCINRTSTERSMRPEDFRPDDVVIGEFLGDSELLVFAPSEDGPRRFLIALPLDPRDDWPAAGPSIDEVLRQMLAVNGEKYWEH